MSAQRLTWIILCLAAGGPCAFLVLETIGIPLVLVIVGSLILIGLRRAMLGETLTAFGLTYAAVVLKFMVPFLSTASSDAGNLGFAGGHILVALVLLGAGVVVMLRRAPSRS